MSQLLGIIWHCIERHSLDKVPYKKKTENQEKLENEITIRTQTSEKPSYEQLYRLPDIQANKKYQLNQIDEYKSRRDFYSFSVFANNFSFKWKIDRAKWLSSPNNIYIHYDDSDKFKLWAFCKSMLLLYFNWFILTAKMLPMKIVIRFQIRKFFL